MIQKGYKPAVEKSDDLKAVLAEIDALDALRQELLEQIDKLPDHVVTLTELRRDIRFRGTALDILNRFRLLPMISPNGVRPSFDLKRALRIRVLLPIFMCEVRVRTIRKRSKIGSILRDYILRALGNGRPKSAELPKEIAIDEAA